MQRVYSKGREEDHVVGVDWNLGNTCNLGCHYCHWWFKSGSNPFPDLDRAKLIVDKIAEKHRGSNRQVRFSFVGGEPTLYAGLPALCEHIKASSSYHVALMTNATADAAYWTAMLPWIDTINITHHAAADWGHTRAIVDLLIGAWKTVNVAFAMMPETFDASLAQMQELRDRSLSAYPQPLYADHARRSQLMPYTAEQRAILFPTGASDIVMVREDGTTTSPSSDHMIFKKQNSFTGMRCGIGVDQIVIDQDGTIRGGWCRVGGALGNVHHGDFVIPEDGILCTKQTCNNPSDLAVPKWRDGHER